MKKPILLLIIALVFTLTACEPDEPVTPPPDPKPPVIEPEVPADIYKRNEIIAANKTLTGDFTIIDRWAVEWAKSQYSEVDVKNISAASTLGFVLPAELFSGDIQAGQGLFTVTVELNDGTVDELDVQVLYYRTTPSGQPATITQSGILAEYDISAHCDVLYDYFAEDPRLTDKLLPFLRSRYSSNVTEYETPLVNNPGVENVFLLGDNTLAILAGDYDEDMTLNGYIVELFDVTKNEVIQVVTLSTTMLRNVERTAKDTICIEYIDSLDDKSVVQHTINAGGSSTKILLSDHADEYSMPGGARLVFEENSLYRLNPATGDKKLLLEGSSGVETVSSYRISTVIDENSFIYSNNGYEWLIGYGLYDIKTGTDYPLPVPEGMEASIPPTFSNGFIYYICKSPQDSVPQGSFSVVKYDISAHTAETVLNLSASEYEMLAISPSGNRVLCKNSQNTYSIFDLQSGKTLTVAEVYSPFTTLSYSFVSDDRVDIFAAGAAGIFSKYYTINITQ